MSYAELLNIQHFSDNVQRHGSGTMSQDHLQNPFKNRKKMQPKSIKSAPWGALGAQGRAHRRGRCDPDPFFNDFCSLLGPLWALIFSTCGYFSGTLFPTISQGASKTKLCRFWLNYRRYFRIFLGIFWKHLDMVIFAHFSMKNKGF